LVDIEHYKFSNVCADIVVLDSAGIDIIFTTSWMGWPKQPIKRDILYHV